MTLIIRGYLGRKVVFEQPQTADASELESVVERVAIEHAQAMAAGTIDMVELEFPEFPLHERYFRFGVNPEGMVMPVVIFLPE